MAVTRKWLRGATPRTAPDLSVAESEIGASVYVKRAGTVAVDARQGDEPTYRFEAFPLDPPPILSISHDQPSRLLSARYRIVKFSGRATELRALADWRDASQFGVA